MEDLSCQELVELVTAYLEDALSAAERARFEAHLADCTGCERYLEQMRAAIALTRASAEIDVPPEISELLDAFRGWKRSRL